MMFALLTGESVNPQALDVSFAIGHNFKERINTDSRSDLLEYPFPHHYTLLAFAWLLFIPVLLSTLS
jgi:hypothetical protein